MPAVRRNFCGRRIEPLIDRGVVRRSDAGCGCAATGQTTSVVARIDQTPAGMTPPTCGNGFHMMALGQFLGMGQLSGWHRDPSSAGSGGKSACRGKVVRVAARVG